jgi:hypothetical protein
MKGAGCQATFGLKNIGISCLIYRVNIGILEEIYMNI